MNKVLKIVVSPTWWFSGWAYTFCVLCVAATVYVLYYTLLKKKNLSQHPLLQQRQALQLQTPDELRSRSLSRILYEFRTPLLQLLAPLEKLLHTCKLPEQAVADVLALKHQVKQLQQLISQLQGQCKPEPGDMNIVLSLESISSCIDSCVQSFALDAKTKNIALFIYKNGVQRPYHFDTDKIQTIINYLILNAIRFSQAGGNIEVNITAKPLDPLTDTVLIEIKYTVDRIRGAKLPFFFKRFYRVKDFTTGTDSATNIDLERVKELTAVLNGTVAVENEDNNGSVIRVVLPLQKAAEAGFVVPDTALPAKQQAHPECKPVSVNNTAQQPVLLVEQQQPGHLPKQLPATFRYPVEENEFLQNLYANIEASLGNKTLTVEMLSRQMALSKRTLYRKLNGLVGLSPNEVIIQYRLKKAAELLKSGMSITDTAYAAGYETVSWFSTSFKNFYGNTPGDFIKQADNGKAVAVRKPITS